MQKPFLTLYRPFRKNVIELCKPNIGQTKRDLKSRIKEHQRAIKFQRPEKSALCQHSMENHHIIDWSKIKILKVEHDYLKRLFTES